MERSLLPILVLSAVVAIGGACSSGAPEPAAPAPDGPESDAAGEATPPSLSPDEARIVEALSSLSLDGQRAEMPGPEGASIWVPGTEPDPLQVVASRSSAAGGDFEVVAERVIRGVDVRTVEFMSGIVQHRFDCDDTTYAVGGAAPPGFDDIDAFLSAFVRALGCDA